MSIHLAAYPHIADNIFDFAPPASRRALRTVSCAFKDRIDAQDLRHISVMRDVDACHGVAIYGAERRVPCMWTWNCALVLEKKASAERRKEEEDGQEGMDTSPQDTGGTVNVDSDDDSDSDATIGSDDGPSSDAVYAASTPSLNALESTLKRTVRVLDIHGRIRKLGRTFLETLPAEVLRIRAYEFRGVMDVHPFQSPAQTTVLFSEWTSECENCCLLGCLAMGSDRAVLHIAYGEECEWGEIDEVRPSDKLREVVIIVSPSENPLRSDEPQGFLFLQPVIIRFAIVTPPVKFTFVDLLQVPPSLLDVETPCAPQELEAQLRCNVTKLLLDVQKEQNAGLELDTALTAEDHIRFLSLEEYAAEIGPERLALEMEPTSIYMQ